MKKTILLPIFLVLMISLSISYAGAKVIDEGDVASDKLNELVGQTQGDVLLLIKNSSTDLYVDSNKIFLEENPEFMLSFELDNKKMYLLHSKEKNYDPDKIDQLIDRYKTRKQTLKDKKDLNRFLIDMIHDINGLKINKQTAAPSKDSLYCANIKDGFCDKTCQTVDIDCLCGDNICQSFETDMTCTEDCRIDHKKTCTVLSDGICDPECLLVDIDCKIEDYLNRVEGMNQTTPTRYTTIKWILIAIMFILASILIYLLFNEIKKRRYNA